MTEPTWRISDQSNEAQLAKFVARLNAIAAQKRADEIDPRFAALRAAADNQDALRNESYREGLEGISEAKKAAEHPWNCKRSAVG